MPVTASWMQVEGTEPFFRDAGQRPSTETEDIVTAQQAALSFTFSWLPLEPQDPWE